MKLHLKVGNKAERFKQRPLIFGDSCPDSDIRVVIERRRADV